MSEMLTQNAEAVKASLVSQTKKIDEFETELKNMSRCFAMLTEELRQLKATTLQDMASRFDGGSTE